MLWRQLRLLLWKSVYLYKLRRNWTITALEVLTPLLLTLVQTYLHCSRDQSSSTGQSTPGPLSGLLVGDTEAEEVVTPSFYFPSTIAFVPAPAAGNVSGEQVLRHAFPRAKLEEFPDESAMVANLSTRTNALGLANNYGVVFEQAERGVLSYTLRFPSWQEFYTRQTMRPGGVTLRPPFWLSGILLPMVSRLNMAVAQMVSPIAGGAQLPPVYFQTRRFPSPKGFDSSKSARKITDVSVIYGFIVLAPVAVKRIAQEKSVGMKELLRIAGISDAVYWLSAFLSGMMVMSLETLLITVFLKLPIFCEPSLLPQSDFSVVLFMLLLYAVYCDLFCLLISCVVKTPVYAVFATVCLWMLTYEVPIFFMDVPGSVEYADLSLGQKVVTSIFPNMALHWIIRIISAHEENNQGARWSNLHMTGSLYDNITLTVMMCVVLSYCVFYAILVWYLDNVWPWQYGIPKEPFFFAKMSYWYPKAPKNLQHHRKDATDASIPLESVGDRDKPGIVLDNVTKIYQNRTVALRRVSLKAYPGDVTVLLGRNGAGKTTLLRLITGLEQASAGSVYVAGHNVALNTDAARRSMGFCPQENILFLGLTVLEHLQFFARIRSDNWVTTNKAIEEILVAFNLSEKRDTLASSLSWGTRRKLQLGVAVVGNPQIVVLDEPTAGADPECKGALWECVLRFHEDKTMLLTTHSMEEADTLGDRIAVLAAGRMRCCGSSLFLRNTYGTGYWIRVTLEEGIVSDELTELTRIFQKHVPEACIEDGEYKAPLNYLHRGGTQNINVGDIRADTLIELLKELEEMWQGRSLQWLSVYVAALEDVLRQVEHDADHIKASQQPQQAPNVEVVRREPTVGGPATAVEANFSSSGDVRPRLRQQLAALVTKKLQYSRRDFRLPTLMLLLPLSVLLLFVFINQTHISRKLSYSGPVEYSLLNMFGHTVAFYTSDESTKSGPAKEYEKYLSQEQGAEVRDLGNEDPYPWLQNLALSNYRRYRSQYIIGAQFRSINNLSGVPESAIVPGSQIEGNETALEVTAWHSGYSPHSSAVSIVAASRAFLPGWRLRVVNHPLPKENPRPEPDPTIVLVTRLMCAVFAPVGLAFLGAAYVLFPVQERVRNVKLLQLQCGASSAAFWGSAFAVDLAFHALCSMVLLSPFMILDRHQVYSDASTIGSLYALMVSYGCASIPLAYVVSLVCDQPSTGYVTIASISIVAGMILNVSMSLLYLLPALLEPTNNETMDTTGLDTALWVFRGIPSFSLAWGISNCLQISQESVMCRYMSTFDRLLFCQNFGLDKIPDHLNRFIECCPEKCHDCIMSKGCLTWDKMSAGRDVCLMLLVGVAFLSLVTLIDSGLVGSLATRLRARQAAVATGVGEHRSVQEECARVEQIVAHGRRTETNGPLATKVVLCVDKLRKSYRSVEAVSGVSFTLNSHECFGLLGMNGAGKTTTFRMLAGDLVPTAGNAYIGDADLATNRRKYQARIGYCPQTDVALDLLTGREMLALYGRLRGIRECDLAAVIDRTLQFVDMMQYADVTTGKYSGGTRRKLSLAVAFVGNPSVVLLDEPTAAVDPQARRRIWNILAAVKRNLDLSILLTSHCMRECETLCSRVAILRQGRFACLGSTQQLKEDIGRGATILARCAPQDAGSVCKSLEKRFPGAQLRRRHQRGALLRFHVMAQMWHKLFAGMEELRAEGLVSEYVVSDVSLTEVFLHFARREDKGISSRATASPCETFP
ncbi:phospholipid-transporting ATPase ABCA3-like isoform X2 [Dermacentor albipictus]|uniref:phospholipid-transporting ATPase ABCA3-like isoform X2 n=1 Tax=Dermacentor albipictus TaxID=60249 RepID=UPI0038FC8A03